MLRAHSGTLSQQCFRRRLFSSGEMLCLLMTCQVAFQFTILAQQSRWSDDCTADSRGLVACGLTISDASAVHYELLHGLTIWWYHSACQTARKLPSKTKRLFFVPVLLASLCGNVPKTNTGRPHAMYSYHNVGINTSTTLTCISIWRAARSLLSLGAPRTHHWSSWQQIAAVGSDGLALAVTSLAADGVGTMLSSTPSCTIQQPPTPPVRRSSRAIAT